jgi:putative transposase
MNFVYYTTKVLALRSHWAMLVMDVVGFRVEPGSIVGISACRMFKCACSRQGLPKHVSADNDPLFRFHRWLANLRLLEIEEIKSVP